MIRLDKRLETILTWLPKGSTFVDVGTDHAYLPVSAIERGILSFAIAADINEGPLLMAKQTVKQAGLEDKISCRLSDGLEKIEPYEVKGATICGMGGGLIVSILEAYPETTKSLDFLLLQPMTHSDVLRTWLGNHGWLIVEEALVEDGRFLYELMYARPNRGTPLLWLDAELGPVNRKKGGPLLKKHIQRCVQKRNLILKGLAKGGLEETPKYKELKREIRELEAIL